MKSIFWKEINSFFSSTIGFVVVGVFLVLLGMIMWIFPDFSILDNQFASLDTLFYIAPLVFLFLIPAITMKSFSEETQSGTFEILFTKPLRDWDIILGKYFAALALTIIALAPTLIYYISVYYLGSPKGNLDTAGIIGSYFGLILLAACFCAIGVFASSLSQNQIIAFLIAVFLCFLLFWGFFFLSKLPFFYGNGDDLMQELGIDYHYQSISRGYIDLSDIIYFVVVIFTFLSATLFYISKRKFS
jgi:ABC-2 type transport system permease protein